MNKVLAILLGPSGFAVIGQFQNFLSMFGGLVGGAMSTGVTQITATNFDNSKHQHDIWKLAVQISLSISILLGVSLVIFANLISELIFRDRSYYYLFYICGFVLPVISLNIILMAIINGKKQIGIYVITNISSSLLALIAMITLATFYGQKGALISVILGASISILPTILVLNFCKWFNFKYFFGQVNFSLFRELKGFFVMGLVSAICGPVSHIIIRNIITSKLSLEDAGIWQACWRVSEVYLLLITSSLAIYYLPKIAETRKLLELKIEIRKAYSFALPLALLGALTIYGFKEYIVEILFSSNFYRMVDLLPWQLGGDLIKIYSWVQAYILIGKARLNGLIVLEIIFSILFVLLTWVLIGNYGLIGVAIAYIISYGFYSVVVRFLVKFESKKMGFT